MLTTVLFVSASAQQNNSSDTAYADHWDTYIADYDGKPGSTVLNMSLIKRAPLAAYPFLVIAGVRFTGCSHDGLPLNSEFDKLYRVSDSVESTLKKFSENILAGTFTFDCERVDYYYVKDTALLRQRIISMLQHRFPEFTPFFKVKIDSTWKSYREFLYPNQFTLEWMGNKKVLEKLKEAGDDLGKARMVDHFAFFKSYAEMIAFKKYLVSEGFEITSTGPAAEPGLFQIEFRRIDEVRIDKITDLTFSLRKKAAEYNGDYDGWETVIVK